MSDTVSKISLLFSLILGALSVVSKGQDFFLQIYWAPEILLVLCVVGLTLFAARLIWAKKRTQGFPGFTIVPRYSPRMRLAGAIALAVVPLAAFAIWFAFFRIPAHTKQEIANLVEAGDISVRTGELGPAEDFYSDALSKDPRRSDVRKKLEGVQNQQKETEK